MNLLIYFFMLLVTTAKAENLELSIGESIRRNAPPTATIKVKGRQYVDIKENPDGIQIYAKASGIAIIQIGDETINVVIAPRAALNFRNELKDLIRNMMGLKLELRSGITELGGNLLRFDDWMAVQDLAKKYNARFRITAQIESEVENQAINYIRNQFLEKNQSEPILSWQPHARATLPASAKKTEHIWRSLLDTMGIEIIYDDSLLQLEPLVRVKMLVAEVSKNFSQDLGIQWPLQISAQISPRFKTPDALEIALNIAETEGRAQILASPNLVARSGGEAEFLAGGEFPIRVMTSRVHEVIWKKHGILLKIKPMADLSGRLKLDLTTEVSMMDGDKKVDDLPQMKTSRISSQFDMVSGKTIILSGLIQNSSASGGSGLVGLRRIPIIGQLFQSQKFQTNQSELVIFVSPQIASPQLSDPIIMPKEMSPHAAN